MLSKVVETAYLYLSLVLSYVVINSDIEYVFCCMSMICRLYIHRCTMCMEFFQVLMTSHVFS